MKSILLTLCCSLVFAASYGQLPANFVNKVNPIPFVNVGAKPAVQGAERGVSQFEVSYHDMDAIYSDDNGFDFGYFGWDMNHDYAVSINTPVDSTDDNTIRWAAVVFDSIYDYRTGTAYKKNTFSSMTVDTVYFLYNHQNVSGQPDTFIVSIYAMAATPSGVAYTSSNNMEFSNTLLWADTTITTTSMTTSGGTSLFYGGVVTGGLTIPAGEGFVVRLDYHGSKQDVFTLADGNRLECGSSAGAASRSVVPSNTVRYYVGAQFAAPATNFSGTGLLTFPSLPANCREFYFQNMAISAVVTVDAPLSAGATATETVGCPGQFVTLNSGASGGSGDYSFTWSGNGNFTSPNSTTTNVALPSGSGTETYTVTIIDNVENTTVTSSVNITVRGISVTLGNDTTIGCGDSIWVTAVHSGYLNGSQFVWSTGNNTQSDSLSNGTHSVTVTNSAGCSATDSKVVSLNISQVIQFDATSSYLSPVANDTALLSQNRVCPGVSVNFENTSSTTTGWSFNWDYGNGFQSPSVDGTVTYPAGGATSYTVTLTGDNGAGCVITSDPLTIQVAPTNFPRCLVDGVAEVELLSNISLYPNPNTGSFIVDLTKVNADDANVMVVDMLGKVVYNSNTFSTSANPVQTVEMTNAANGIYFVRITANGVIATSKISVAK